MDRSKRNEAGWVLNEAGNVIVYPVVEQHIAGMHGMGCVLRFEISTNKATGDIADTTFQIQLTPSQAAALAKGLQETLEASPLDPSRPN